MSLLRVIFTLEKRHTDWLREISEKTGASMSWQIRRLIDAEIAKKREVK